MVGVSPRSSYLAVGIVALLLPLIPPAAADLNPVAVEDHETVYEDRRTLVPVVKNDYDPEGEQPTVTWAGSTGGVMGVTDKGGTLDYVVGSVYVHYTPPVDQHRDTLGADDRFRYTIRDPGGKLATAFAYLDIVPRNDPPRMTMGPTILTTEDHGAETILNWAPAEDIVSGPEDELGQAIVSYGAVADEPALFSVQPTFDATGTVRFTPAPDQCTDPAGTPVSIIMADDGGTADGGKDRNAPGQLVVPVVIACETDPPQAFPDDAPYGIAGSGPPAVTVYPLDNDVDPDIDQPDGDFLEVMVVDGGTLGTASLDATRTVLTYTANEDKSGYDTIRYRAVDSTGHPSDWAEIHVRFVCPTLILEPDAFSTPQDVAFSEPASSILGNDQVTATGTTQVTLYSQGTKGTVTMDAQGAFTYTPNAGATGIDTFRYRVVHTGTGCQDVVPVEVELVDVNDPPTANPDTATIQEDSGEVELPVLANDSSAPDIGEAAPIVVDAEAPRGRVRASAGRLLYAPPPDFSGEVRIIYKIQDPQGATSEADVLVTVTPMPDEPRGGMDRVTVRPGRPSPVGNLLTNDGDPDGDRLHAELLTQPAHGTATLTPEGELTLGANPGFSGEDRMTYLVRDATGLRSPPVAVDILVADNVAPVARFSVQQGQVAVGAPVTFTDESEDPDGSIAGRQWEFGDGSGSDEAVPVHAYTSAGHYVVRLQVVDNDGRLGTATAELDVVQGYDTDHGGSLGARLPVVSAGTDQKVGEGAVVQLAARMVDGTFVSAVWRQTEGPEVVLSAAETLRPQFNAPDVAGPGPLRLAFEVTVFDGVRRSAPDQVAVDVHTPERPPTQPKVDAGPDADVLAGERVRLSAAFSGLYEGEEAQVQWQQVSGPSVGVIPSGASVHVATPAEPGAVLVFRAVGTARGEAFSDEMEVTLGAAEAVTGFRAEPGRGRAASSVTFQPLVPGAYTWSFGDGATSGDALPTHTYAASGPYNVTLTVVGEDGQARTYTREVRVHAQAAAAAAPGDGGWPTWVWALGIAALAAVAAGYAYMAVQVRRGAR